MKTSTLSGSCLCGEVRFTATGEESRFYHCHCKRCRKATGTGHASNLFLKGTLRWEGGEELVRSYKPPEAERFTNTFCSHCGGRVPRFIEAASLVFIPAGSLDVEPQMKPHSRIFTGSSASWSCDGTDIPTFNEYPQ